MKQISTEQLLSLLEENKIRPLIISDLQITGNAENITFSEVHFVRCRLSNFNTHLSHFENCHFIKTQFIHSTIHNTTLNSCHIQDSSIFGTSFLECKISTCKISNTITKKIAFTNSSIEYTKFICNPFIANVFTECKIHNTLFEYTSLDASTFFKCIISGSTFESMRMRGINISECNISNTTMNYIDFDDIKQDKSSKFMIPLQNTNLTQNITENLIITNSKIQKSFKNFGQQKYDSSKFSIIQNIRKSINRNQLKLKKPQKEKIEKIKEETHVGCNIFNKNIGAILTFALQFLLTILVYFTYTNFNTEVQSIYYASLPSIIDFPLSFIETTVEIHKFAFYFSLIYFTFSGVLLCLNVVCIRGVSNLFLIWIYRIQSVFTLITMLFLWWCNIPLKSMLISLLNLFFALYFAIMIIQSFNTGGKKS